MAAMKASLPALSLSLLLCSPLLALEGVGVQIKAASGVPMGIDAEAWKDREFNAILYSGATEGGKFVMKPALECLLPSGKKGDYLRLLAEGGVLQPIACSAEYDITFPTLDLRVVNNSKEALHLSEVRLAVAESRPDPAPLPLFFSGYTEVQHIVLMNEGWGRIEKADFEFALLPSKPKGQPGKELPFKRSLFRIEKEVELPLHDELEKAGVAKELIEIGKTYQDLTHQEEALAGKADSVRIEEEAAKLEERLMQSLDKMLKLGKSQKGGPFPMKLDELDMPTMECWMSGWMTYTWKDGEPEKSRRVALCLPILILPPDGLGAPMPASGKYEAMLRESAKDYALKVPVSHVVKKGDATRFTVTLGVPKSSFHHMKVTLATTDGKEIDAGEVDLQALLPRHAVTQLEDAAKAGEGEKEEGE
jgi:hypothetical protein